MPNHQSGLELADNRLDELFAEYLEAAECGELMDRPEFAARHPELAEAAAAHAGLGRLLAPLRELTTTVDFRPDETRDRSTSPAGQTVGDYEILEVIGQDGQGIVYKARSRTFPDMVVALKKITPIGADSPSTEWQRRRFLAEVQNQTKLDHPNIVSVTGGGEHEGHLYFTMKLIEGGDLRQLAKDKPVAPREVARLVATIARAVHHAHQRRILHRDLKPSNVLLGADGEPYVADFGLSKLFAGDDPIESGYLAGAPAFVSPEQIDGKATVLSDVYGLGTILYWLLTGRPPIEAQDISIREVLRKVREENPLPPRIRNPQLNHWWNRYLQSICLKCLEKDPQRRYQSADALAVDLERWLRHWPPLGVAVRRLDRQRSLCIRRPLGVGLTLAAVVLLLLSAVMANLAASQMERRLREAALRGNRRAAERVADNFCWLLREQSRHVLKAANDKDVRALLTDTKDLDRMDQVQRYLATGEWSGLQDRLKNRYDEYNAELEDLGIPPFATMFFLNKHGRLVGHAGPRGRKLRIIGARFDRRDYFTVARRYAERGKMGMDAIHISRVFKSEYDTYFKFAISMPAFDEDGAFLGVVEASIPMDDTLGLAKHWLHGEDQKVVLAGRIDPQPSTDGGQRQPYMEHEFVVLLHEAFGGAAKESMRKSLFSLDDSLDPERSWPAIDDNQVELHLQPMTRIAPTDKYTDPLGAIHSDEYGGKWLAGFAQVGNTELMVIVQQKHEDVIGQPVSLAKRFVWWGWSSLALACILAGIMIWQRHRRASNEER